MAEQVNPLKPLFKDIANAIREKDGTTELIPHASDFPARIRAIPSGGGGGGWIDVLEKSDPLISEYGGSVIIAEDNALAVDSVEIEVV